MDLEKISAILNGLDNAVFVIDQNRRILIANNATVEFFGSDLVGDNFVRAVRHPDCLKAVEFVLGGASKTTIEISLQNPVKTIFRVKIVALPASSKGADENATDSGDTPDPAAVISFDNISHIFEAEQMRSDFVANVSHELRSPLTALTGFIETLRGPAKDDEVARARFLDTMDREAKRMNRLIGDLLSLSKVEVEAHIRPSGVVDITSLLEQVILALSPLVETEGKSIRLDETEHKISLVIGDGDQLEQVFQNLIENALKYGNADTEVVVSLFEIERKDPTSPRLLAVEVQDFGPGIPAEHIPRLTERFYRVDRGRSRDKGGTGLGLAIVKHIINRHRGRLMVKSEMGKGSTFTVTLPIAD